MPGDLHYAHEKLSTSILIMATHPGSLQERLADAWASQGMSAVPMVGGQSGQPMSQDLADNLLALHSRLTGQETLTDEKDVNATVLKMSDEEAQKAIREVLELEAMVEMELWDGPER